MVFFEHHSRRVNFLPLVVRALAECLNPEVPTGPRVAKVVDSPRKAKESDVSTVEIPCRGLGKGTLGGVVERLYEWFQVEGKRDCSSVKRRSRWSLERFLRLVESLAEL